MRTRILFILGLLSFMACSCGTGDSYLPSPVDYGDVTYNGELKFRIQQNMDLLQAEDSLPGEICGLEIMGLLSDARASRKASSKLNRLVSSIPSRLNSNGFIGPEDGVDDNLLSSNGWMLKGLCAYYDMSSDRKSLDWITSISNNLFVNESNRFKDSYSGVDGLVEAYRLVGTPEMKEVIEGMLDCFLKADPIANMTRTDDYLSACRGLVSYGELTGDDKWITEAEERWELFREYGMTENFGSYGRLGSYDSASDPCAVADSYMLSMKLWQCTMDNSYLRDAHLIYYNALCHSQRSDGSFGIDSCPGEATGPDLSVVSDEIAWPGSMKGAEALATAATYSWMRKGNTFYVTSLRPSVLSAEGLELEIQTEYPFEGTVVLRVSQNLLGGGVKVKLYIPDWAVLAGMARNGQSVQARIGKDGFLTFGKLKTGDVIQLDYSYTPRQEPVINEHNNKQGKARYFNGPLILSEEGKPIYHLMDTTVTKASGYHHQIIFNGL